MKPPYNITRFKNSFGTSTQKISLVEDEGLLKKALHSPRLLVTIARYHAIADSAII